MFGWQTDILDNYLLQNQTEVWIEDDNIRIDLTGATIIGQSRLIKKSYLSICLKFKFNQLGCLSNLNLNYFKLTQKMSWISYTIT